MTPHEDRAHDLDLADQEQVNDPAKVMRIGRMAMDLLDELRVAPLDEAGRLRLRHIHETSIGELASALSPDLASELNRLAGPPADDPSPSEAQVRVAQAQLVGWLEGLLRDMDAALLAAHLHLQMQQG